MPPWLDVDRILGGFGRARSLARRRYAVYVSEADASNPLDEVIGGSLLGSQSFLERVRDRALWRPAETQDVPDRARLAERPSVDHIVEEVGASYHVPMEHILSRWHKRNLARDVAIYLSRELTGLRGRELGRRFGGITGSGITIRCGQVTASIAADEHLARKIARLRRRVGNS